MEKKTTRFLDIFLTRPMLGPMPESDTVLKTNRDDLVEAALLEGDQTRQVVVMRRITPSLLRRLLTGGSGRDSDYSFNDVRLAIALATTSRSLALSIGFGT